MTQDHAFAARMARIETLTELLDRTPDLEARSAARELVGTLLDLHAEGLSMLLEHLAHEGDGRIAWRIAGHAPIASLLLLHGLHPEDLETRVNHAIDDAQSRLLARTAGELALVSLVGQTATLRLSVHGGCGGACPSSLEGLQRRLREMVLEAVPDVDSLEFEEPAPAPSGSILLPVITLGNLFA